MNSRPCTVDCCHEANAHDDPLPIAMNDYHNVKEGMNEESSIATQLFDYMYQLGQRRVAMK